jgi:hypothetical protein
MWGKSEGWHKARKGRRASQEALLSAIVSHKRGILKGEDPSGLIGVIGMAGEKLNTKAGEPS